MKLLSPVPGTHKNISEWSGDPAFVVSYDLDKYAIVYDITTRKTRSIKMGYLSLSTNGHNAQLVQTYDDHLNPSLHGPFAINY